MLVCTFCDDATSRGPGKIADLQKEGFVDRFNRFGLFSGCCCKCREANRPARELLDNRGEQSPVLLVQALAINRKKCQCFIGERAIDRRMPVDLSVIPNALQKPVCNPRRSPAS